MKFTSYDKMSKKDRKLADSKKRVALEFSPVTRVKPSAKVYNRKRWKNEL